MIEHNLYKQINSETIKTTKLKTNTWSPLYDGYIKLGNMKI